MTPQIKKRKKQEVLWFFKWPTMTKENGQENQRKKNWYQQVLQLNLGAAKKQKLAIHKIQWTYTPSKEIRISTRQIKWLQTKVYDWKNVTLSSSQASLCTPYKHPSKLSIKIFKQLIPSCLWNKLDEWICTVPKGNIFHKSLYENRIQQIKSGVMYVNHWKNKYDTSFITWFHKTWYRYYILPHWHKMLAKTNKTRGEGNDLHLINTHTNNCRQTFHFNQYVKIKILSKYYFTNL